MYFSSAELLETTSSPGFWVHSPMDVRSCWEPRGFATIDVCLPRGGQEKHLYVYSAQWYKISIDTSKKITCFYVNLLDMAGWVSCTPSTLCDLSGPQRPSRARDGCANEPIIPQSIFQWVADTCSHGIQRLTAPRYYWSNGSGFG